MMEIEIEIKMAQQQKGGKIRTASSRKVSEGSKATENEAFLFL